MKGAIAITWRMFWIFMMVAVTLVIVVTAFRLVLRTVDDATWLNVEFNAAEIAGVVSTMQASPEGARYEFTLPSIRGCRLRIYRDFLDISSSFKQARRHFTSDGESTVKPWRDDEDCRAKPKLIFEKRSDGLEIKAEVTA